MPSPIVLPTSVPRPSLDVSHRDCGDALCVVAPVGEIDLASAPMLKSRLVGLLDQGFTRFVLDLSGVRYLDSTGLGVLIAFDRRLNGEGQIVLAQAPGPVVALLELTGLDASFDVYVTDEDALAHLRGEHRSAQPLLSSDATIVMGLASTALPFAESAPDELRRWLRILSAHGEAGRALRCAGVTDTDATHGTLDHAGLPEHGTGDPAAHLQSLTRVAAAAAVIAADRHAASVSTVDLLLGVMTVYGDAFDRELRARGSGSAELIECLASSPEPAAALP
jgi:anti-sigma B factor antagonist